MGSIVLELSGNFDAKGSGWTFRHAGNEATPTNSFFIRCFAPPAQLVFGQRERDLFQISNPVGWVPADGYLHKNIAEARAALALEKKDK